MTSVTLSFINERQVLTVIQPMLPLYECVDPAPTESPAEPLHFVGDSAAIDESIIEPLHSVADPAAVEFLVEPPQSIADSDAAGDALIETSCS
jgi:hypothetical protein